MDCIFCKIVNGELPCFSVYEDDLVKVFLDINPTSKGHMLVVPKKHFQDIFDTPSNVVARISEVCKKMALLCKDKLKVNDVNIVNASGIIAHQSVFHIHFHVIPRTKDDGLNLQFHGDESLKKDIIKVYDTLKS